MAAAVLLYAVGAQDQYLSGSPSMTYFQTVYTRHTPFLVETYEVPMDNPTTYGMPSIATIPPRGDLITGITLKTTHSPLIVSSASRFFCWPTWPSEITSQPKGYILQGGQFVVAFEAIPSNIYYSSYNIGLWTYQYYPATIQLSGNAASNTFSYTGATTVYFLDTFSAVFYGMDPRNPDTRTRNAYGYTVSTQRNAQLTFIQSGWVLGITPQTQNISYFDGIGTRVIDRSSLLIGGQTISSTTGRYIDLRNDMDVSLNNQTGLTVLVGKNDTSPQYINRICYTQLDYGLLHIPTCALERQDVQVTLQFAPLSNVCSKTVASDGSLFSANAYTCIDMRAQFGVNPWNTIKLSMYKDTMAFQEQNSNKQYFFNMQQPISNVAAFQGPYVPSGATYLIPYDLNSALGLSGKIINSNIYSVTSNGYVTRLPVNDYFVNNVNTTVTSTVPIWANGAYGPIINNITNNQGDGSLVWRGKDARSSSGQYLYYYAPINYVYLPTSNVSTAWYSGSVGSGTITLTHTFFGTTSPTQSSIDEWVLYVKARDTNISSNTSNTNTVSGSNCRVQMTFTTSTSFTTIKIANYFGDNRVVIRYDTTMGINDPAAYYYYKDLNSLFNYPFTAAYVGGWGDPTNQETLNLQGDGRYLYMRINDYILVIDTPQFNTLSGYALYNWYTGLTTKPNIFGTPIVFDNNYGYMSMKSAGASLANNNMSRFRIGSNLGLDSSWEIFDTTSAFPWLTINNNNNVTGASRNMEVSAFDGRYVYYVLQNNFTSPGVLRYDTLLPFQASSFTWIAKHWSTKVFKTDPTIDTVSSTTIKSNDYRNWVATDSSGNIFIASYFIENTHVVKNFDGTTFQTLTNTDTSYGTSYIVKYNSAGVGQWIVSYASVFITGPVGFTKIMTDSSGNLYVGIFGQIRMDPPVALYNSDGTQYTQTYVKRGFSFGEGAVFKVNSSGFVQWFVFTETRDLGATRATSETGITDMCVDGSGNVYFSGTLNSPGGQGNGGSVYMNLHSSNDTTTFKQFYSDGNKADGFIAKCNSSGVLQWASNVSSSNSNDFGETIKLTSGGEVFFTGRFTGSPLSVYNADGTLYGTLTRSGTSDIFMIKYNASTGAVTAASTITNGRAIGSSSCATDSVGNAYIGVSGDSNVYVYKINTSTLATTWISQITAKGNMIVGVDSSDSPYAACYFDSNTVSVYDSSGTLYQTLSNSTNQYPYKVFSDALFLKYTTSGNPVWVQAIQGRADEFPLGLNIDATGNTWVLAGYLSPNLKKTTDDTNPIVDPTNPSIGQESGASTLALLRYASTNGTFQSYYTNTLSGDDRFITSAGTDLTGVDPGVRGGGWVLTIGPRYMYLYQTDGINPGQTCPNWIQFDPTTFSPNLTSSLLIDYVYLSRDELNFFREKTQDYVIERMQKSSFPISSQESYKTLTFDSPVKELLVTLMSPANQNTYTYSNVTSLALTLNGETLVDQDSTLFQFVEPWETKLRFPSRNVFTYSFGSPVNFSRIRDKQLRVNVPSGTSGTLDVYARTHNVLRYRNGMAGLIFNSRLGIE